MNDAELARRSARGFAEMVDLLGGRGRAPGNPWLDALAVVPGEVTLDEPDAPEPHAIWSVADVRDPRRTEHVEIAMPILGLALDGADLSGGAADAEAPSLDVVGAINDRAYGQDDALGRLLRPLDDPRLRPYGVRVDGAWACVLMALRVDDDVAIHYVATEDRFRRRGLATRLILAALRDARAAGATTATLQASPDGLPVYERMGFRRVGTLRAFRLPWDPDTR
jgi:ribosomal protein S18 acetylase RimI-like enzyme